MPRIAVLGAAHVGPVIARVAIEAGYQVSIAASGDPEKIELITKVLVPGAEPRWAVGAVNDADIVVLAIPLHNFATFDSALVVDKLVVDTMNYWRPSTACRRCSKIASTAAARSFSVGLPGRRSSRLSTTSATTNLRTNVGLGLAETPRARRRWRRPGRGGCRGGNHRAHRLRHRPTRRSERRPPARTRYCCYWRNTPSSQNARTTMEAERNPRPA